MERAHVDKWFAENLDSLFGRFRLGKTQQTQLLQLVQDAPLCVGTQCRDSIANKTETKESLQDDPPTGKQSSTHKNGLDSWIAQWSVSAFVPKKETTQGWKAFSTILEPMAKRAQQLDQWMAKQGWKPSASIQNTQQRVSSFVYNQKRIRCKEWLEWLILATEWMVWYETLSIFVSIPETESVTDGSRANEFEKKDAQTSISSN
jgi:hypothetical protein